MTAAQKEMRTLNAMLKRHSKPESIDEPHGGRLLAARRLFPSAPEPFIDLSTGINPLPYPIPAIEPPAWTRLPEPEEIAALEAAAAAAYGANDPDMVASVPGTQGLISLLPALFPQMQAAILGPTYGEYAHAFAASGTDVIEVDTIDQLRQAPCAVLCNPNNPDGRRHRASDLLALVAARRGNGLLLIDESFADLEDETLETLVPHLPLDGVVILRSLSKSYGLGGLRLGFALADPELAVIIRSAFGPWPVSGPAIAIGTKALADRRWREAAGERLRAGTRRLDAVLGAAQLTPVGGTLLFRLVESPKAEAVFRRLGEAGILIRRFDRNPSWLRFGIPGDDAWGRLEQALATGP